LSLLEEHFQQIKDACALGGVKDFEIYGYEEQGLLLEIEGGACENQEASSERGIALRIRKDGRQGLAASRDLSAAAWLVSQALETAESSSPRALPPFRSYPKESYHALSLFDPSIEGRPLSEKLALAIETERLALAQPKITRVVSCLYQEQRERVRLVNSAGLDLESCSTQVALSLQVMAESKKDSREGWEANEGYLFSSLDPASIAQTAAQRAAQLLGAKGISSRRCPVIFSPYAVSELLSLISSSFSAESVRKQTSRFAGRLGEQVAAPCLTLLDDPFHLEGAASSSFDEEGTPRQRLTLLREGVLGGFLYDETEAFLAKTTSTGHASRGDLESLPSVSPSNLVLQPGTLSAEQLTREMGQGLWVQSIIGAHLASATTGEFSFGAVGLWCKGGIVQKPVAEITIAGDLFTVLKRVTQLGSDTRFYGNICSPSLLVDELAISG
jgi:PmbA protein